MSDITDWEPELNHLNAYDLNVIGDYVSTLKAPTNSTYSKSDDSTMSETVVHDQADILRGFAEMQNNCKELADRLDDANKIIEFSQQKNILQAVELIALREKARNRVASMKQEVKQELKAVEMILSAICESNSTHSEKKQNLRLCLEILSKIPTFDRGQFFNYEDDF